MAEGEQGWLNRGAGQHNGDERRGDVEAGNANGDERCWAARKGPTIRGGDGLGRDRGLFTMARGGGEAYATGAGDDAAASGAAAGSACGGAKDRVLSCTVMDLAAIRIGNAGTAQRGGALEELSTVMVPGLVERRKMST